MSRGRARAVAAAASVILLLAILLRLVPPTLRLPSLESPPPVSAVRTMPDGATAVAVSDAYREVVEGNVLSPNRQPPSVHVASPRAVSPSPGGSPRLRTYRLSGIVRGPEGVIALIDADPAVPGAELYRLGDRVGPYRIVGASDSVIVLRGASGTQVLRLHSVPGRIP